MEIKDWKEYENEEKTELLIHWWNRFGEKTNDVDEILLFNKLIVTKPDEMYDLAVASYIMGISNQWLLQAMRGNFVEQLLDSLGDKQEMDDTTKGMLHDSEKILTSILVETYNNPQTLIYARKQVLGNK